MFMENRLLTKEEVMEGVKHPILNRKEKTKGDHPK